MIKELDVNSTAGPVALMDASTRAVGISSNLSFLMLSLKFFAGYEQPASWTSTQIVHISKVDPPISFQQLRPISLCNVSSKNLSKLLSNRLGTILAKVISPEQSGFIRGRMIQDNILLAQELRHIMGKRIEVPIWQLS